MSMIAWQPMMFIVGLQCSEQDQNRDLSDLRSSILVKEALTAMKCQIWLPVERKLFSCIETTVISLEYYLQIFIWGWVIQSYSIRVATLSHWQNDQYQLMDTVPLLRFLLFPSNNFQSLPTNEFPPNGSITNSFCSHFWFEMFILPIFTNPLSILP